MQFGEAGGKQGAHTLQQNDMTVVCLKHHAVTVDVGGRHRLFAENVFAGFHQGDRLLRMAKVGAGDIDGVHLAAGGKLGKVGESEDGAPLGGELGGTLRGTGINSGEPEIGVLLRFGEELLDDGAGADGGKTDHGKSSLVGLMGE